MFTVKSIATLSLVIYCCACGFIDTSGKLGVTVNILLLR